MSTVSLQQGTTSTDRQNIIIIKLGFF